VLDVNYSGSTGYGRAYRDRLKGQWGVADVEDAVAGATAMVQAGKADADRLAIRGGSAGGYTTLAALTFHSTFKAGASYYGISDIEVLARDTHKFESRYLDSLVGPYPAAKDRYIERSPIHFTDKLSSALILFQGLEDKVVPPNQSQMMAEAVRKKGLPVAYITYEGEQHGFRKAENIVRSLEAELSAGRSSASPRPTASSRWPSTTCASLVHHDEGASGQRRGACHAPRGRCILLNSHTALRSFPHGRLSLLRTHHRPGQLPHRLPHRRGHRHRPAPHVWRHAPPPVRGWR
jgi:dienelactone hydrolase